MSAPRHFIIGTELTRDELLGLIERARQYKSMGPSGTAEPLRQRAVALIFEIPSTRTRVSFEVGISQLGGVALVLRSDELQLSRGESVRDTALVLSRYVQAIVARLPDHSLIEQLAQHAEVPVVNALTPLHHPCQALADFLTLKERFGELEGLKLAYVGDGNNVCNSLIVLGTSVGVEVAVACPPGHEPDSGVVEQGGDLVSVGHDPAAAAAGAHALYTDVWVSMGDEAEAEQRRRLLQSFRLDEELLEQARDDAIVLHCLPAHPGEEITEGLLYGARSAVWDQAENRLHAQKALLEFLLAAR
jgi:ornithine carbamoyltransferase